MIYHLTSQAEWKEAQEQGIYVAPSLETEGFIHCSIEDQLSGVFERFFKGRTDLVVLHIDERALDSELKFDPVPELGMFPHVYGAINLEAVVKAEPYAPKPALRTCATCNKPKAAFVCGVCEQPVCKDCDEFLEEDAFSFRKTLPDELKHVHYCPECSETYVEPALVEYAEQMELAKGVYFFFKTQKRELPVIRRGLSVETLQGVDRNEVILRLAFRAVEQGFNGVIESEVECEKVRKGAYQTSIWHGEGLPALLDAEKLEARRRKGLFD